MPRRSNRRKNAPKIAALKNRKFRNYSIPESATVVLATATGWQVKRKCLIRAKESHAEDSNGQAVLPGLLAENCYTPEVHGNISFLDYIYLFTLESICFTGFKWNGIIFI